MTLTSFDPLPRGHFRVVMIDPATDFKAGKKGRPQHYERMSDRDIAALPVVDLIHPRGGWILLWTTSPKFEAAFRYAAGWSRPGRKVRFSTRAILWLKLNESHPGLEVAPARFRDFHRGMGMVTMKNAEDLWAFRVGACPMRKRGEPELLVSPVRDHSQKPDEAYDRVERMFYGPRADIFSRQRRPGWHAFGNQLDHFPEETRFVVQTPAPIPRPPGPDSRASRT